MQFALSWSFKFLIICLPIFSEYNKYCQCDFCQIVITSLFYMWQDGGAKEKLCALLGLYVLQIMVITLPFLELSCFIYTKNAYFLLSCYFDPIFFDFWFNICFLGYTYYVQVLVSISMECKISKCVPLVSQLSHFFPFCHLSYLGLITGFDVDTMTNMIVGGKFSEVIIIIPYVAS